MAKDKPRAPEPATLSSPPPALDEGSVILALDPEGKLGEGAPLRPLGDEPAIPGNPSGHERYEVVELVGEGGMGRVYLVYDRDLKRRVALKTIRDGGDRGADAQRRFVEECQVLGQLEHPGIVPLLDLGLTHAGRPYYTMRYVRGLTLRELLDRLRQGEAGAVGAYSLTRLVQIFLQVTNAIGYAHAKGVIHRDIKAANVVIGEHGEVQVLDWGLSLVLREGGVHAQLGSESSAQRVVVGTPGYMSPEQALGKEIDARCDIYALGVLLYEMLTLRRPFEGETKAVIAAHLWEEPVSPRARAPERQIPLALERVTLQALRKRPEERPQTAGELLAAVQGWLEAEADRTKRRQRAVERAAAGRKELESYRALKERVAVLDTEAKELSKRFNGWQTVREKAPLYQAQDSAQEVRRQLSQAGSRTVATLTESLAFEPEHAGARDALADYYWDRLGDAEEKGDLEGVDYFGALVATYHDGKYARELKGDGALELDSTPSGAEVWLYELIEEELQLVPRNGRLLGTTPVGRRKLPMGSYLVVLKREGHRDVRYPVNITRNREWSGNVNLYTEEEIGRGMVYVPAGPFIQGGDPDCRGWDLPRSEPELGDFCIAEHPVTIGEYLEYLNDLARSAGLEVAKKRGPRYSNLGPTDLPEDGAGGLKLPEVDLDGDRWDARHPAMGISWNDAAAYCAWRAAREGREYRLPTESEWEKAARGVDGRWFPWGWRLDSSLCNLMESRNERPVPVAVEEYPADVSVYGVRGMAGNARDWTATEMVEGEGSGARVGRVVRGGGWGNGGTEARCAYRNPYLHTRTDFVLGFRVACAARRARS